MDREKLAWAGGLFEGEGCFTVSSQAARPNRRACARLSMTDLDVVERFAETFPYGRVNGPYDNGGDGRKPIYHWSVEGFEKVQALLAALWPFLGERRRQRAVEILRLHGTKEEA